MPSIDTTPEAPGPPDTTPEEPETKASAPPGDGEPPGGDGPTGGDEPAEGGAGPGAPGKRRGRNWIFEVVIVVLVAALLAVVLRTFVVQTFFIPSGSMEPTLQIGDRILVDKLSYELHGVGRGDIVVFKRPPAENCGGTPVNDLVKRVIGLPGDHISSVGNSVILNGHRLSEPYIPKGTILGQRIPPTVVPANSYYVMGDNRGASCDSRYWGPVARSLIVGKVVVLVWPLSRFHIF